MPWIEPDSLRPIFRVFRRSAPLRARVFGQIEEAEDFLVGTDEDGYIVSRDSGTTKKQSESLALAIQGELYACGGEHLDLHTIAILIRKGYIQIGLVDDEVELGWAHYQKTDSQ